MFAWKTPREKGVKMTQTNMSAQTRSLIQNVIRDLKQQRDELRLQLHLGGEELKDQ